MRLAVLGSVSWQLLLAVNERRLSLRLARRWFGCLEVSIEPTPIELFGDQVPSANLNRTRPVILPFAGRWK